ncbi:MAG: hypothetical protein ACR2JY_08095 [Chloroflexota bacterium]
MDDVARARALTAYFGRLQGLRLLPLGLVWLALAVATAMRWQPAAAFPFLLALGLAALLSWAIDRYYDRTFGRVRLPRPAPARWLFLLASPLALLLVFQLDDFNRPPVSLVGLAVALTMLLGCGRSLGWRRHWLALVALLAGLSLLPLTGQIARGELFGPDAGLG